MFRTRASALFKRLFQARVRVAPDLKKLKEHSGLSTFSSIGAMGVSKFFLLENLYFYFWILVIQECLKFFGFL